jgi:flagellin-like protein
MQLKALFDDDDAVSPVIGVILMVAITVILAAVIATFVLGLGDQVSDTAPQASWSFEFEEGGSFSDYFGNDQGDGDGLLTATHSGGATLEAGDLAIRGATVGDEDFTNTQGTVTYGATSEISAGDDVQIVADSGDTVRITWTSSTGEDSATLAEWSGPDA